MTHLRDAAARDDDGPAHLSGLDDHFAGQAASGVKNSGHRLSGLHDHPARDGVYRVVTTHIFYKYQHLGLAVTAVKQRASVYRSS